ncbi:LAMI_0C05226g1_1 [Lachancea mirantina]|uniref:Succinate dehydrogenase [ubiquinone] cytochrome b small subunit n=1 Tax=Lachancea mirantina TaxID=1230905 RepID=A0A1G4J2H2_9SACH|nr:LAMI_0C05226g1_1 [Lachancea mirantina]
MSIVGRQVAGLTSISMLGIRSINSGFRLGRPCIHTLSYGSVSIIRPVSVKSLQGTRQISSKPSRLSQISNKWKLKTPPPGGVTGDVNTALKPPEPDYFHGSYHWDYERISAISLIPLAVVPVWSAFAGGVPHPILDATLSSMLIIHVQQGLTSCIIDYIPMRKFGPWHKLAMLGLYTGSALGIYGIYVLETENNGLIDLIGRLWKPDESNLYIFGTP